MTRSDAPLTVLLRPAMPADLARLYELQSDPEANRMAGTKPRTREAFLAVWDRVFADPRINSRVIEVEGEGGRELVGSISVFQAPRVVGDGHGASRATAVPAGGSTEMNDCLGYWIAKPHWGRGIASRAVAMFLTSEEHRRPLHATAARANVASLRVLEKCGFRCIGYSMGEETDRFVSCEIAEFELTRGV